MKNHIHLLSKKISWVILIAFFIFDNFFSYYAVTRLHGREANLAIAFLVEKYPFLYFLCIPATLLIMFVLVKVIRNIVIAVLRKLGFENKEIVEQVTLNALVIYWAIGNSFMNLAFLLGHRLPLRAWALTSFTGVVLALGYSFVVLNKLRALEVSINNRE